jgi:maltose-binding protein MalE
MNGSAPQSVIDGVNADFKAKHPNVTVNVEIQQWSDVGTKLDTAFAGSTPPDVMELGNTLVAKYAAAGALQDIGSKKSSYDNSATWLQSLTDSCTLAGKLYCVPYYAGSRAVIYRKDLFDAAGVQLGAPDRHEAVPLERRPVGERVPEFLQEMIGEAEEVVASSGVHGADGLGGEVAVGAVRVGMQVSAPEAPWQGERIRPAHACVGTGTAASGSIAAATSAVAASCAKARAVPGDTRSLTVSPIARR